MAKSYRPVDRGQEFLLPPSMLDWLSGDHLVWFVIEAVKRLDTAAFHRRAKLGGVGRRGYDPDMLLTLFIYAMAHGESSSRRIERLCHTDVAFRVVCAQDVPDHTVLARFRKNHEAALTALLTESLVLAAELGMVSLGVVAFDGTKIAANASKDANRSEAHLRKLAEEFVEQVAETDEAEDALFGEDNRGDELPEPVADRTHRGERITQALEQIAARRRSTEKARRARAERAQAYEQAAQSDQVPKGPPPRDADPVVLTRARWQRERAKAQARYYKKQARRGERSRPGPKPVPPDEHSYDTAAELELLNKIYALLRLQINFFSPHQKLVSKRREGAKVIKKYDTARTPYQRILADNNVTKKIKNEFTRQYRTLNPAQIRRDLIALSDRLLDLVTAKHQPTRLPVTAPQGSRAKADESTKPRSRAS